MIDKNFIITNLIRTRLPNMPNEQLINSVEYKRFMLELDFLEKNKTVYETIEKLFLNPKKPFCNNRPNLYLAYLLGITNQNCDFDKPFKLRKDYKLTRYSPPDIDADFMNNQPIYDYVIRKYGQDRVANVGTWNTWQLKQAIQDAVKFNYSIIKETDELGNAVSIDQVAKTISKGIDLRRLKAADEEDEENQLDLLDLLLQQEHVKTYYEKYPKVFEDAKLMLGIIRFVGKHAAGIVISDVPIEEIVPLHRGTNDQKLTQFDKEDLEDLGLLKMDILALKNLETIYKCIDLIKARHNITIDIRKVKPVEGKVFKMLADGFTQGVFQFEGHGMTSLLKRMHPTGFNDLVAGVAIYRPGPLQNKYDEMYIERKKNPLTVQYPHEVLKDVLKDTYGVFLFQEQIMAATRLLAGFNDTEADEFRKIIGKKQIDKLPEMRTKFVSRSISYGLIDEKKANELFDQFEAFGYYAFNKCLSGDTKVLDKTKNELVSIDSLCKLQNKGSGIILDSFVDGQIVNDEIVEVFSTGVNELFELQLTNGMIIKSTINHKFLCENGTMQTVGEIIKNKYSIVGINKDEKYEIVDVKSLGLAPTYNITMKSQQHNYAVYDDYGHSVISANSHSVAYSFISYQTAYLKAFFTLEYFAALMSVEMHSGQKKANEKSKLDFYEEEATKIGIELLPIDINLSKKDFTIEGDNKIRYPIGYLKGCGERVEQEILMKQPFSSPEDFINKVETSIVNSATLNILIDKGAFDAFGTKKQVRAVIDRAKVRKDKMKIRNGKVPSIPRIESTTNLI